MASIVLSTYAEGHAQRDGTRYVTFAHTWDGGVPPTVLERGPLPMSVDLAAVASAQAAQLMEVAADQEFEATLGT